MMRMKHFDNLVKALKSKGYKVDIEKEKPYNYAIVKGNNITAGFCSLHSGNLLNSSYPSLNGKISADHKDCFDKWQKCPLVLPIPKTNNQLNYLLSQLEYWASKEGYEISNGYGFEEWIEDYPVGIDG